MTPDKPRLYIGNHNYSSWSLRPWLCLRWAGIEFEEILISLANTGFSKEGNEAIAAVSPNRKVPVLHIDGLVIWDSLAICEWVAETRPDAKLWPSDWRSRAIARSAVCEMHSGFAALRTDLPMNIARRCQVAKWRPETQRDIDRIISLWLKLREGHAVDGPWLCGQRGLVDAYFAPVMSRFRTYGVALPDALQSAAEALFQDPDFKRWEAMPKTEAFTATDELYTQP